MHLLLPIPLSIVACYTDIRTRKIKNYITYPLILLGVFINTFLSGFNGFKESILGILFAIIITALIPVLKLGGGDLKLAMAYGAFLTYKNYIVFFFLFILLTVLGNVFLLIKKEGVKVFLTELKLEFRSFGTYKTKLDKITGAPFLLGAYILTLIFFKY